MHRCYRCSSLRPDVFAKSLVPPILLHLKHDRRTGTITRVLPPKSILRLVKEAFDAEQERRAVELKQHELEELAKEYDATTNTCCLHCSDVVKYVSVAVYVIATVMMGIVAMASNREWPGFIEGNDGEEKALRLRRFDGYPGLCDGEQYDGTCSSESGDESTCNLWNWSCRAIKDVIRAGTLDPRAGWICQGNEEQLEKFERAANYQVVGMSLNIVFALLLLVAVLGSGQLCRRNFALGLAAFGTVGMGVCSALMLASLPIIDELYTTKCSPLHPSAEDLGWTRSDDVMAAFNAMSLLCVVISGLLLFRREIWIAVEHHRRHRLGARGGSVTAAPNETIE